MIRTFHNVGQGALYSEDFKNFMMIYDCGSYKNINLIINELKNSFDKNRRIDAVFISHFHEDHINGLEFLLKNFKVKYLFIPYLTNIEKMVLLSENAIHGTSNTFVENIILNPEVIRGDTQIIKISPEVGPRNAEEIQLIDNQNLPLTLQSGSKLRIGGSNWVLIPFHFRRKEKTRQFEKLLNSSGLKINKANDLLEILEDKSKYTILENCYKKVKGTLNSNSLVLYSGPSINNNYFPFHNISFTRCFDAILPLAIPWTGCLYFGDYDASGKKKWDELNESFSEYWVMIGTIQVPHHGSRYNYNKSINDKKPLVSIISCGEENHFRHPHGSVLKDILKNNGFPLIVTEKPITNVLQIIELEE